MHVDEGSYDTQENLKVCVISSKGETTLVECGTNLSVDRIKLMALTNFIRDQVEALKVVNQYKLVSINKKRSLSGEASIRDENIVNGDTLLLLDRYPVQTKSTFADIINNETAGKGPNESMILEATKHLKPKNLNHQVTENVISFEFQQELRPILISLVDYAEKLLRHHPDVAPVLKNMKVNNDELGDKGEEETIDDVALKQLTDMGFAEEKSRRALRMNNMSPLEAMDWLLAYESSSSATSSMPSSSSSQINYDNTDIFPKVPAIVDCYRKYKRQHFVPNMNHFNNLKQLGFDDDEILDGLWLHSNNEVATGEWLLKEKRPRVNEFCRGLKRDSPIYKAFISNPSVQLALVKPRIFFAFVRLIEDPNCRWTSDHETSAVIQLLYRIYHSERNTVENSEKDDDDDDIQIENDPGSSDNDSQ
ncbi:ubiquitin-associated domain-containing protein 1 [Tetranychus urticae]|uniref:UBA domain-containing protein n=1 Tax=Tetranychus urticae TaxID=32264 RepID=T1KAY1_TETUR|nr:ubiquitin-associated domain-containing protein 1 [Tetranychus urticae]